jgi:hypothetical protein
MGSQGRRDRHRSGDRRCQGPALSVVCAAMAAVAALTAAGRSQADRGSRWLADRRRLVAQRRSGYRALSWEGLRVYGIGDSGQRSSGSRSAFCWHKAAVSRSPQSWWRAAASRGAVVRRSLHDKARHPVGREDLEHSGSDTDAAPHAQPWRPPDLGHQTRAQHHRPHEIVFICVIRRGAAVAVGAAGDSQAAT